MESIRRAARTAADDPLLLIDEVSELTRAPVGTLRYWRHLGLGPHSARVGRRVLYRRSDVLRWLDEQLGQGE